MRRRTLIAIGVGSALHAQTNPPAFEVAAIRKYAAEAPRMGTADGPPPPPPPPLLKPSQGGLTIENATLKYCLVWAYGVRNSQVSGPSWINECRYSIHAKTGTSTEIDQLKKMLQALLTARFRLAIHRDTKERPVLGIVAARGGIKLAPSNPGAAASQKLTPLPGGVLRIEAKNTGLPFLEQILSLPIWDPVVNLTGLTGEFDFTFERPPFRGQPDDIQSELNAALQRQLGLRLEPRKAPLEMLEIESGDPNPIEN